MVLGCFGLVHRPKAFVRLTDAGEGLRVGATDRRTHRYADVPGMARRRRARAGVLLDLATSLLLQDEVEEACRAVSEPGGEPLAVTAG